MRKILSVLALLGMCSLSSAQITLSVNQQNVQCFGMANGSATITPNGGTPAYSYTWMPGGQNTAVIGGLSAGQYTVYVEDAAAATGSLVVVITEPTAFTSNVTSSGSVTCNGASNGFASVGVSGGSGSGYTYIWAPIGAISPIATNLLAGSYTITIFDANGCMTLSTVTILQPPPLMISTTQTNTACGNCNGSASMSWSGGTFGVVNVLWSFSNGQTFVTPQAQNLCAGMFTVSVTDANACVSSTVGVINTATTPLPNTTVTSVSYNETCYLSGDGTIDISITGTNPGPFTYLWNNGATTQDIANVVTGNYWVTIADGSSNCLTLYDTISNTGINCGTISGNVYMDNNSDCINNLGDNSFQNILVTVNPGNRLGYTNPNGDYIVNNLPYGTYSVTLANLAPTCTPTLQATVSSGNPNSINNPLSVAMSSVQPDMYVWAYSNGIVPGFVCRVNYYLSNNNYFNGYGIYKVILPATFISNITNVFPSNYTISADTVLWNFSNIVHGNTQAFYIDFTTPLSTPLGSIFTSCIWAQPTATDLNYTNNNYCYSRTVSGSFDPNDKTVSPVGIGATGDIPASTTDLTYLIRFQNTGNGPAVNIVVKDTLSSNLDMNTFEILHASHAYNIDVLPGNVLRWKFNNIILPDSNSNEPASHGYIQYRIKRNSNNTPGTQIKNTAYIYFDFNAPIVTNTALNTIETITSVSKKEYSTGNLLIYPNPTGGKLKIIHNLKDQEKLSIRLVDVLGKEILNENYKQEIDISHLEKGIYFLSLYQNTLLVETRKIIKE